VALMGVTLDAAFYGEAGDDIAFYGGVATSDLVPNTYHVSIGGRPYLVDFNQPFYRQYNRALAPLIRSQADTSKQPSEQTLDPNGLWRRSFEDWSLGAGQRYLDRTDSVDNRFWSSKGIDCLTSKWQIGLLYDTLDEAAISGAGQVCLANGTAYVIGTVFSQVQMFDTTGAPAGTVTGLTGTAYTMTSDGYNLWVGTSTGIFKVVGGSTTASSYGTTGLSANAVLGYVNSRLMLAEGASVYNITTSGALPSPLFTHGNANWTFTSFAEGEVNLYFSGFAGTTSYIYGTGIVTDGSTLAAPTVQGRVPPGETIQSITGCSTGGLVIGTSLGVRYATVDSSGAVTIQSLIPLPAACQCAVQYGRYVWFGWSNYDGQSTGLGRMDLENFVVAGVQPAYASDLMSTSAVTFQGAVTSVVNQNGVLWFTVQNGGLMRQTTLLVPSGTVQSGYILYDLADQKIATLLDIQTQGPLTATGASYTAALSVDAGLFNPIGTHVAGQPEPVSFGLGGVSGQRFETQLTLTRSNTATVAPIITRMTMRSYPAPRRPVTWQLPLLLYTDETSRSGSGQALDPLVEVQALEAMAQSGEIVSYQEGLNSFPVFVQDVKFLPDLPTLDSHFFNGLILVTLEGLPPT
jgi:hypothetical protein